MEEWLEARTDITDGTKKGYRAYLKGFRKHFAGDPKDAPVEEVFEALDELSLSCKTKMLNMLSQYTGLSEEYGKQIRQLNKKALVEHNENRPVVTMTTEQISKKISEDISMPSDLLLIYNLVMIDNGTELRLEDYQSLEIGSGSSKNSNWINKSWTKIRWNTFYNNKTQLPFVQKLPESFKVFKQVFSDKTKVTDRNSNALKVAIARKNKELGIPRGLSMFKSIKEQLKELNQNI